MRRNTVPCFKICIIDRFPWVLLVAKNIESNSITKAPVLLGSLCKCSLISFKIQLYYFFILHKHHITSWAFCIYSRKKSWSVALFMIYFIIRSSKIKVFINLLAKGSKNQSHTDHITISTTLLIFFLWISVKRKLHQYRFSAISYFICTMQKLDNILTAYTFYP